MEIVWLPVIGFEGRYEVSSNGQVRSLRRGIILKPGKTKKGYLTVQLSREGKTFTRTVHSLVAEAFIGLRPSGQEVRHGPGGQQDNSVINLSYGTHIENCADMIRDGTKILYGSRHPSAKLTEQDVIQIRRKHIQGEPYYRLAEEYNVHEKAIFLAATGGTWKHVSEPVKTVKKRLTDEKVAEIRQRYAEEKISQQKLASEYKVCTMTVSNIVRHATRKGNDEQHPPELQHRG